jgi:hypothetical protein
MSAFFNPSARFRRMNHKFTEQGWERRFEWLENGCVKEIA